MTHRGSPLTAEQANTVYDVLVQHAGAAESGRADFVFHQTDRHCPEYRFVGSLGLGGKFWNANNRWYVSAYPEDVARWPDLADLVNATNAALDAAALNPAVSRGRPDHRRTENTMTIDPLVRGFDFDETQKIVNEARRNDANPIEAVRKAFNITRSSARSLVAAVKTVEANKHRYQGWDRLTQAILSAEATTPAAPAADVDMPLRPGDVFAAGLADGRCPVGIVTAVNEHAFRLDLYSWVTGGFSAGTAIVRHEQVREFSDLAVQDDGGVFQMDPLAAFQRAWTEAQR